MAFSGVPPQHPDEFSLQVDSKLYFFKQYLLYLQPGVIGDDQYMYQSTVECLWFYGKAIGRYTALLWILWEMPVNWGVCLCNSEKFTCLLKNAGLMARTPAIKAVVGIKLLNHGLEYWGLGIIIRSYTGDSISAWEMCSNASLKWICRWFPIGMSFFQGGLISLAMLDSRRGILTFLLSISSLLQRWIPPAN